MLIFYSWILIKDFINFEVKRLRLMRNYDSQSMKSKKNTNVIFIINKKEKSSRITRARSDIHDSFPFMTSLYHNRY